MSSQFDASASMLGYLFQVRLALVDSLRRLKAQGSFSVSIEKLDDVAFEAEGQPADLLQTKLHIERRADLTDASEDLWKTIRIWTDGFRAGRWSSDSRYYLVTTSRAPAGSAAGYLRPAAHNAQLARARLDATAQSSTSHANASAYKAYTDLSPEDRLSVLDHVSILDDAPDIVGVHDMLRQELAIVVVRELTDSLITRLEGWWFQRVIRELRADRGHPILSEEIDAELERLRQQFRQDNLPIDADLLELQIVDETMFASHVFVEQLRLVDLTTKRILTAMRQYFRASEQRSRWLREGFLHFGELDKYDRRLCEEWETRFDIMAQELGEKAAEVAMKAAARKLYEWAELESQLFIRPACQELFVSRGSLQILSDGGKVGWHPEFLDRLKHLLEKAS